MTQAFKLCPGVAFCFENVAFMASEEFKFEIKWRNIKYYAKFHAKAVGISKSGIGLNCYIDKIPLHMCTY